MPRYCLAPLHQKVRQRQEALIAQLPTSAALVVLGRRSSPAPTTANTLFASRATSTI